MVTLYDGASFISPVSMINAITIPHLLNYLESMYLLGMQTTSHKLPAIK